METGIKVITTYKGNDLLVVFTGPYSVEIYDTESNMRCLHFNELERATIMRLAVEEI